MSDIDALVQSLRAGTRTVENVVRAYLQRRDTAEQLGAIIAYNPDVEAQARALDAMPTAERQGLLWGVPVLIKDNIETSGPMATTAGSIALAHWHAPQDAHVIASLRREGALILGKANLSEWANYRSRTSTSGWSSAGGQTRNPYARSRTPSGSSAGSAVSVAAGLAPLAVGTETNGSIVSPASINSVVGVKPTVGLVSRSGIVPISATQDTAGPMALTVRDAALMLSAMVSPDAADPASVAAQGQFRRDYLEQIDTTHIRGARLGITTQFVPDARARPILAAARATLTDLGAELIDCKLPKQRELRRAQQTVLSYEFKAGMNAFLQARPDLPFNRLSDLIAFNDKHADKTQPWFGQDTFNSAQNKGPLTDGRYQRALARCRQLSRTDGIDSVLQADNLDAIVCLTTGPACTIDWVHGERGWGGASSPAAISGYPHITVPAGYVFGLPVGLSFFGTAFQEPALLSLAAAFEDARAPWQAPGLGWETEQLERMIED